MLKESPRGDRYEQVMIREKIAKAYHKHRGNLKRVVDEVGLPYEYVRRLVQRLRNQQSYEVSTMVVDTIMQRIYAGYNSRVEHLADTLHRLEDKEHTVVSLCCHAPVGMDGNGIYYCDKCKKSTTTVTATEEMVIKLKQEIIAQLRQEDIVLVACAEKMRYTEKFMPLASRGSKGSASGEVIDLLPEADKLSPMGVQLLINKISQNIGLGDEKKGDTVDAKQEPDGKKDE